MLAKIFLLSLLATAIVANPLGPPEEDDDLPVYTEKVMQAKPTKPGKPAARIPRFNSKKLSSSPKKSPAVEPEVILKAKEPIRSNARPIRRTSHNALDAAEYFRPALRAVHNAPRPSYAPAPELGVEYDVDAAPVVSRRAPALVDDYVPRRLRNKQVVEYGSAAGNAPELTYAVAPKALSSESSYANDYKDEHPQPYIFGYEFQDEKGATQNRQEQGDERGAKRGSYGYRDEHGIYRQVEYVADKDGFRAVIKTNEPGTENQNPADVQLHSEAR